MKFRQIASVALSAALLLPTLSLLSGCGGEPAITLRVYNWEEYIDDGGEGSYVYDLALEEGADEDDIVAPSILEDFEQWYFDTYHEKVKVVYSTFGTNEDMYNELKLGNEYDLLCPSDYMIMKLANETKEDGTPYLEKYDESFFDKSDPLNYYIRNVSPYIQEKFETNAGLNTPEGSPRWSEYAAGYMWGTTGFVYNPEAKVEDGTGNFVELGKFLEEHGWQTFVHPAVRNKITAKDNVRDTYFAALGVAFEEELLALDRSADDYIERLTAYFNATDEKTIDRVEPKLMDIKKNIYSFETDTGKADMVSGKIYINYAWSGDAVYALDEGEAGEIDEKTGEIKEGSQIFLDYYVPEAGSNLWFDGWVMTNGVTERGTKKAAQAFVNYMSMPESAKRNSYYIGYTSVIAGENREMLDYTDWLYGVDEEEGEYYDLSYFFGSEAGIYAEEEQRTSRQLFAQFPPEDVIARCAVMDYYREDASERINELWSRVKAEMLDAWAIIVICVTVAAIALFTVFVKFGGKIDFFRPKPKKGYHKVN